MNCTRIETNLMAYLDGRSNAGERREIEAHLKTCPLCRERAEEFRSVSSLLEELPQIEPSAAFDVRVRARVAAEPESRGWLAWLTPSPRAAFAAMLLLALPLALGIALPINAQRGGGKQWQQREDKPHGNPRENRQNKPNKPPKQDRPPNRQTGNQAHAPQSNATGNGNSGTAFSGGRP